LIAGGVIGWMLVAAWTGPAASTFQLVFRNQACGMLFALVLLGALEIRGTESRFTRLVAGAGTVSYGLYLWHWFALEVIGSTGLRIGLPLPSVVDWGLGTLLLAAATLPIAVLSWHLVERRAITWSKDRIRQPREAAGNAALAIPMGS
jgi:peptidoglycan/LPS O-acetylase OafA/YrhL